MTKISGTVIVRLMRNYKMTIRAVATRMNITLKRVREVRLKGIEGECMCKDWMEAISGTGAFAPKVTLPDGYAGSTRQFFVDPIEIDKGLVKLACVDAPYMHRWARKAEVDQLARS